MVMLSFDAPLDNGSSVWKTPEQWLDRGRRGIASAFPDAKGRIHIDDTSVIAEDEAQHKAWLASGLPF